MIAVLGNINDMMTQITKIQKNFDAMEETDFKKFYIDTTNEMLEKFKRKKSDKNLEQLRESCLKNLKRLMEDEHQYYLHEFTRRKVLI